MTRAYGGRDAREQLADAAALVGREVELLLHRTRAPHSLRATTLRGPLIAAGRGLGRTSRPTLVVNDGHYGPAAVPAYWVAELREVTR